MRHDLICAEHGAVIISKMNKKAQPKSGVKKARNHYIDAIKGVAILLVVLGHAIQYSYYANGAFDQNIGFRLIYSFHMPLFMFISGVVAAFSIKPIGLKYLKQKFYVLIIPFFAWYVLGYIFSGSYHTIGLGSYVHRALLSPDYGLWFLWVLFLNFCCLAVIKKLESHFSVYAYLIVWLAVCAIPTGYYGVGLVKWQLPFFLLGYLIYANRGYISRYRNLIFLVCIVSFPILAYSWHRLTLPQVILALEPRLLQHHLLSIPIGNMISINVYETVISIYKYGVALSGIGFIFWLLQIRPSKYFHAILAALGLYTLDIYAMHFYFLKYSFGDGWLKVISGFVIALTLSLLIGIFIIRRFRWLDIILLGGRSAPRTKKTISSKR